MLLIIMAAILQEMVVWNEFLSVFSDQVSSDGAQDAMTKLQDKAKEAIEDAKLAKIHVINVFMLKSLKPITDCKAGTLILSDSDLIDHKCVLSRQIAEISKHLLGVSEDDFLPFLYQQAKVENEGPAAAAGDGTGDGSTDVN